MRISLPLIVAAAIAPLLILMLMSSRDAREAVLQRAHASVQSLADETAASAAAAVDEARRMARQLAANAEMQSLDPARCLRELGQWRALNPHYTNLGSVEASGRVVCSLMLPAGAPRPTIGDPPWLQAMRRDGQGKIAAPQRGIYSGDWIAVVAEPIAGRDGGLRGAAQVVIRLSALRAPVQSPMPREGFTGIVSRQGRVIARSVDAEQWIGRDVSGLPVGRAITEGRHEHVFMTTGDGVERLFAFKPIVGTDWIAVAGTPSAGIRRDVEAQTWRGGLALGGAILLGGLFILLVRRRIAAPLEELRRTAEAVADGDTSRRAVPDGPLESQATASAVNRMLDRIGEAESRLRTSEAHYRTLFETSPDAMRVICDERLVMLNPAAVHMFGFESAASAVGASALATVAPEAHAMVREAFRQVAFDREIVRNPDVSFVRADGVRVHAEVVLLPFTYEGRPAVLSVLHDLTQRHESLARIARLSRARDALSGINAAIVHATDWPALCKEACRIVVEHGGWNICMIRGLDPSDGCLRRIAHFGDQHDRLGRTPVAVADSPHPAALALREAKPIVVPDLSVAPGFGMMQKDWIAAEGVSCGLFVPIRTALGPLGTFSIFGTDPAHLDAGFQALILEIGAALGFAHDKLAAEAALRESEARFRALTAMSSDWYWETDAEHRFTRVSRQSDSDAPDPAAQQMLGQPRWDSGLIDFDPPAMAEHRARIARHEPFRDFEVRRHDRNGRVRTALISGAPVFDAAHRFLGYRGVGRDISIERAAIEARVAAERQYRLLFDAMPAAVTVVSDGRVVMANSGAIELFGCGSEAATLGRDIFDTIAPEFHAKARERIARVVERGETIHTEDLEILRADGSRVWVELVMHPFEFNGRPAIVRIVRDNTARRAAHMRIQRLAELKEALSGTVEAMLRAPDWIGTCKRVCDIAGERGRLVGAQIRMFNPASNTLDSVALSEGMAGPFGAASVPADAPYSPSATVFQSGKRMVTHDFLQVEGDMIGSEARRQILQLGARSGAALPIKSRDRVVGVLAILARESGHFNDELCEVLEEMTDNLGFAFDKMQAENALAETEERFRRLVEASGNGIMVLDGHRIEFANPAFARMLELPTAQAAQGLDALDFVEPAEREETLAKIRRLESGEAEAMPPAPVALRTRMGTTRIAQISAIVIQIRGQRRLQVEARDITVERAALAEIQALNRELEQRVAQRTADLTKANEDLESFAYSIAHDLRAPLRTMNGFAQLLRLDVQEGSATHVPAHVERIIQGTRRMGQLIDGLLSVARISREIPLPEPLDFNLLLGEVLAETNARTLARVELGPMPTLRADATLMRQVWTNLVSNALKYSAKTAQPAIEIDCRHEGDEFIFRIRDNGVGFNPAEARHLFGVFQRLHADSEFEGTGIGLAIVRRIVERHGGRVWADAALGAGATFSVALPAALQVSLLPDAAHT